MYYFRLIEKDIEKKLKTSGAVLVYGPKFCGKTTTCMLYQKSFVKLNTHIFKKEIRLLLTSRVLNNEGVKKYKSFFYFNQNSCICK